MPVVGAHPIGDCDASVQRIQSWYFDFRIAAIARLTVSMVIMPIAREFRNEEENASKSTYIELFLMRVFILVAFRQDPFSKSFNVAEVLLGEDDIHDEEHRNVRCQEPPGNPLQRSSDVH